MREHDFKRFPELTNKQMEVHYFESPHKQIMEDFRATVTKVHDGDTIKVRWDERDFEFPIRLARIQAPELSEEGGDVSRDWLRDMILGEEVEIRVNRNDRVEKWGRLLGDVIHMGISMSDEIMRMGLARYFKHRKDGYIPSIETTLSE